MEILFRFHEKNCNDKSKGFGKIVFSVCNKFCNYCIIHFQTTNPEKAKNSENDPKVPRNYKRPKSFNHWGFKLLGRSTWWSRRELNSRLTGLPKGFLHAYAAIILRCASLRPKKRIGRNLKSAVLPTSLQNDSSPPLMTPAISRRERGADEPLKMN